MKPQASTLVIVLVFVGQLEVYALIVWQACSKEKARRSAPKRVKPTKEMFRLYNLIGRTIPC